MAVALWLASGFFQVKAAERGVILRFGKLVDVVGQTGCGYESQLEAWYRALVDPEPRLTTKLLPCGSSDAATSKS